MSCGFLTTFCHKITNKKKPSKGNDTSQDSFSAASNETVALPAPNSAPRPANTLHKAKLIPREEKSRVLKTLPTVQPAINRTSIKDFAYRDGNDVSDTEKVRRAGNRRDIGVKGVDYGDFYPNAGGVGARSRHVPVVGSGGSGAEHSGGGDGGHAAFCYSVGGGSEM